MANLHYIPAKFANEVSASGETFSPHSTANTYLPFTFVKSGNDIYVSIQNVPTGIAITNTNYWLKVSSAGSTSGVTGVKGNAESAYRTGNVNLTPANLGAAPLASPTFTGIPKAPTASMGDRTTQIATTDFVQNAIEAHLPLDLTEGGFGANISNVPARSYFGNHSGTAGSPSFDVLSASDITDGALSITHGGTGQAGTSSNINTITEVITAASNITIQNVSYRTWGKIAQLLIGFRASSSLAANATIAVGTIVSGKRPVMSSRCGWINNTGYIDTAGALAIRNITTSSIGTSTTIYVSANYLLP